MFGRAGRAISVLCLEGGLVAFHSCGTPEGADMSKAKEIYEMITADYFPAESLEHRRDAILTLGRMARKGNREAIEALKGISEHPYVPYELRDLAKDELAT
jgi:hypothetical protein